MEFEADADVRAELAACSSISEENRVLRDAYMSLKIHMKQQLRGESCVRRSFKYSALFALLPSYKDIFARTNGTMTVLRDHSRKHFRREKKFEDKLNELSKIRTENFELADMLSKINTFAESTKTQADEAVASALVRVEDLKRENESLREELKKKNQILRRLRRRSTAAEKACSSLRMSKNTLIASELRDSRIELDRESRRFSTLKDECRQLRENLDAVKDTCAELRVEVSTREKALTKAEETCAFQRERIRKLEDAQAKSVEFSDDANALLYELVARNDSLMKEIAQRNIADNELAAEKVQERLRVVLRERFA
eukprot:g1061.t1